MTILSSNHTPHTPSSKKKTSLQQPGMLLKEKSNNTNSSSSTPINTATTTTITNNSPNHPRNKTTTMTTPSHHSIQYQIGGSFNSRPLLLDDENIFCVPLSQNIAVYSNSTGKHIHTITFHKKKVTQIIRDHSDSNDCSLFSVSEDGYLCHWNIMVEKNQSQLLKQVNIGKPIYGIQQDKSNAQILYLCVLDHFYSFIKLNIHQGVLTQEKPSLHLEGHTFMTSTTSSVTPSSMTSSYLLQMYQFTQMNISKTHLFAIGGVDLYIYNLKKQELETTQTNEGIPLTAMAFCEENEILATADARGVISLWFSDGTRSSHHWHPSIVTCLQFSEEGDYLYSSGVEGVVVCWRLPSQKKDKFLVTDTAIQQFTLSSSQDVILVLGKDNIIRKYEFARFSLLYRIFGMNTNLDQKQVDQIQVTLEPHSSNILVSGTDSLQWYNINDGSVKHYECVQFRDVKYDPSRFQETLPVRTIIEHIAYSSDGQFMAHVESFGSYKQNLKFWQCSGIKSSNNIHLKPQLVTVIDSPHQQRMTRLLFVPSKKNSFVNRQNQPYHNRQNHHYNSSCCCLTSSLDGKIRIWKLSANTQLFSCSAIIEYKNLSATSFDVSSDGTLLAACFGCEITLWDLQSLELIESFSYPYSLSDCKFVNDDSIAVISDRYISLFSIAFESKNVWSIDAGHVEGLVSNGGCGKFAVIMNGSDICQFDLKSTKDATTLPPLRMHLETDHFVNALFYYKKKSDSINQQDHDNHEEEEDELYFLNKQFEVYRVVKVEEAAEESSDGVRKGASSFSSTATHDVMDQDTSMSRCEEDEKDTADSASTTTTSNSSSIYEKKWPSKESFNKISLMDIQKVITTPFSTEKGNKTWKEIFSAPSHSLISMSSCYTTFMNSFVLRGSQQHSVEHKKKKNNNNNTEMTDSSTNSSLAHYATSVTTTTTSQIPSLAQPSSTSSTTNEKHHQLHQHTTTSSSSNSMSLPHDDHVELPSADLIRFLKSYAATHNKQ
ncbi:hypothetical protein FDP41_000213 [Naegleria fowleri]|uniref:WD repeat-containing protein 75 second beta-propeller domain-containing protein n=1 Tax=Naegleria fowleri TaxID=5763 RepID=A0A6A5CF05_NAEFO|nr:uncharacterized protein FDP41_000213 [Naegleria fowleri]KAF0985174.1 hypothetical protein FDP41_000213 [Naegleria fowleri]